MRVKELLGSGGTDYKERRKQQGKAEKQCIYLTQAAGRATRPHYRTSHFNVYTKAKNCTTHMVMAPEIDILSRFLFWDLCQVPQRRGGIGGVGKGKRGVGGEEVVRIKGGEEGVLMARGSDYLNKT